MPNLLSDDLRSEIASIVRQVLREELTQIASLDAQTDEPLLTPQELSDRLNGVPLSWVYEQSRLNNIPTVRIGRYIRFRLSAVLASEAAKIRRHNPGGER